MGNFEFICSARGFTFLCSPEISLFSASFWSANREKQVNVLHLLHAQCTLIFIQSSMLGLWFVPGMVGVSWGELVFKADFWASNTIYWRLLVIETVRELSVTLYGAIKRGWWPFGRQSGIDTEDISRCIYRSWLIVPWTMQLLIWSPQCWKTRCWTNTLLLHRNRSDRLLCG